MDHNLTNIQKRRTNAHSVFSIVASSYQIATKLLSFGIDSQLKKRCVKELGCSVEGTILDLATGSGDFIPLLRNRFPDTLIAGFDLTIPMLVLAKEKAQSAHKCILVQGDMIQLSLRPNSVSAITGGYALRNAPDLDLTIQQIHQVLKPGGIAVFLEFTRSHNVILSHIQVFLLQVWCGLWGLIFHGKSNVYGYIADTVKTYPDRLMIHNMFRQHSFEVITSYLGCFGFLEILTVKKR